MRHLDEYQLSAAAKRRLRSHKACQKALKAGSSVQHVVGFSQGVMADFYQAALNLFTAGHYEDAADAFLFLVGMNLDNLDFWLGFGMASQMNREFETAIDAYEVAAITELDNPVPYFYLAKCFFALHERDSALAAIQLAIEHAADRKEYQELKQLAITAQQFLVQDKVF